MKSKKTVVRNRFITYLIAFFGIILLVISVFLIASSLNIKTSVDMPILTYNEKRNIDYNVYLKENNYFTQKVISKDELKNDDAKIITSLIDYIDIFYDYSFSSSKPINGEYSYKIIGTLKAHYKVDAYTTKQVWNKDYVLAEGKIVKINKQGNFVINENIKINYDEYNKIIDSFKKDYMLAVDSNFDIAMIVELNGNVVDIEEKFKINNDINISIPLSEQTIEINTNYEEVNNDQIINVKKLKKIKNIYFLLLGIFSLIVSIAILVIQILKVIQDEKKQSVYLRELRKLLHDYGDIIIEVKKAPKITKENSIEVMNFSELVNAQMELRTPIVFSEVIKNKLGLFVLFNNEHAYYYTLKSTERKKKA